MNLWTTGNSGDLKLPEGIPTFGESDGLPTEIEIPDDCPIQILKLAKEVCDYYHAPQMHATTFESKLNRLQTKVSAELRHREASTMPKNRV